MNRMPIGTLNNASPLFPLFHEHSDYSFLCPFSSACWPNLGSYNNRKLSFRCTQCFFLGYSSMHKSLAMHIYFARVMFDEGLYMFSTESTSVTSNIVPPSYFPLSKLVVYDDRMQNYNLTLLVPIDIPRAALLLFQVLGTLPL
jgi:hypothetical protein